MVQGGWLILLGNLVALWVTVGFLAGRAARNPSEATLLGALAEAAAVVAFYLVKYATEGVPWVPTVLYLLGVAEARLNRRARTEGRAHGGGIRRAEADLSADVAVRPQTH